MDVLKVDDVLDAVSSAAFLAAKIQQVPGIVANLPTTATRSGIDLVWEVIAASRFSPQWIRLVKDGAGVLHSKYIRNVLGQDFVDPRSMIELLEDGATLCISRIHQSRDDIRAVCDAFQRRFNVVASANMYLSIGKSHGGFGRHIDHHDVIAVQLAGAKRWRVYSPVVGGESRDLPEASQPDLDVICSDGSCLYIPSGFPHAVETTESPSIHITFGLNRLRWCDVLELLLLKAPDALLTSELPDDREALVQAVQEQLAPHVASILDPANVESAAEHLRYAVKLWPQKQSFIDAVMTGHHDTT